METYERVAEAEIGRTGHSKIEESEQHNATIIQFCYPLRAKRDKNKESTTKLKKIVMKIEYNLVNRRFWNEYYSN